jgi:hypothetical protein
VEKTLPPAIAAAGITAAASIGSSLIGGHAAKQAANDQSKAAQAGINEFRTDLSPWLQAGQSAVGGLEGLLGLSGADAQQSAITGLQNGPLFQSLYKQGQNTILANGAATGGLRGGNMENSLANFGSDLLAQVIQMQIGNLNGLSGQGLAAGGDMASAIAQLLGQKGAAQAGGAMGSAQGITGALNGVAGFLGTPGLFGSGGSIFGGSSPSLAGASDFSNSFGSLGGF